MQSVPKTFFALILSALFFATSIYCMNDDDLDAAERGCCSRVSCLLQQSAGQRYFSADDILFSQFSVCPLCRKNFGLKNIQNVEDSQGSGKVDEVSKNEIHIRGSGLTDAMFKSIERLRRDILYSKNYPEIRVKARYLKKLIKKELIQSVPAKTAEGLEAVKHLCYLFMHDHIEKDAFQWSLKSRGKIERFSTRLLPLCFCEIK